MQKTQREIAMAIFAIHRVMDFLDDGHHTEELCQLVRISNGMMDRLTPENQKKMEERLNR